MSSFHIIKREKLLTWYSNYIKNFDKRGQFSVKSSIAHMKQVGPKFSGFQQLHKWYLVWSCSHLKLKLLVWFLLLGRLNTRDHIKKFNMLHDDEDRCVLCNAEPESLQHLFFLAIILEISGVRMYWLVGLQLGDSD